MVKSNYSKNVKYISYNERGITLISLIVTIIVLIILAIISIATLTGDNGIIKNTEKTKVSYIESNVREHVNLGCTTQQINISQERLEDRNYSAKANSSEVQKQLIEILNNDKNELNGIFSDGGIPAENNQDSFIVVYKGEDYSNASNDTEAKITYTIGVTDNSIKVLEEKAGNIFTVTLSINNENAGTVSFIGEHSGTSIELKGEQEVSFAVNITNSSTNFVGWYIDETLISTETTYKYTVRENTDIIAKFETVPGLYETGSNYSVLLKSWDELIDEGIIKSTGESVSSKRSSLAGDLVISDTLTSLPLNSYFQCSNLTGVVIPDSVTSIGDQVFYYCSNLEHVTIGKNVTSIGSMAFNYCTNLTNINIPDSVTNIGSSAFADCTNLKNVNFGNNSNLTNIDQTAFQLCTSLESIEIPDGVESIGKMAFRKCSNLKSVTLPENLTSVQGYVFSGCTSLEKIKIPNLLTKIENYMFRGCTALSEVEFSNSITTIGESAFYECAAIVTVKFDGTIEQWCAISFTDLYSNPCSYGAELYINGTILADVNLPKTMTKVNNYLFKGCTSIKNVKIPDGATSIGSRVFDSCTNLESIEIPVGVQSIESYALYKCSSLTNITYKGTTEQWEEITKNGSGNYAWNSYTGEYTIFCTDGTIAKDGTVTLK